ncbi:hypothetical protein EUX98_g2304 [Antrodiella citrinella]|uniref:Uncharacterized protein n=1 Tax=Antrodiella citrinella TaxID=2447956 RepID=A0A4S4MZA8_9APHY|nr:hypothetical protein EUX98_g2304 [Antrodiella citrinella]
MFIPPQLSAETAPGPEYNAFCYHDQYNSLDVHLDKLHVVDALTARDVAVYRLQSACASIRAKEQTIHKLEREKDEMKMSLDFLDTANRSKETTEVFAAQRGKLLDKISSLEAANKALKLDVDVLRTKQESMSALDTPRFNEMAEQTLKGFPFVEEDSEVLSEVKIAIPTAVTPVLPQEPNVFTTDDTMEPEERMKARHAILADLPIPSNMPTDTLIPIVIPPPFSIHDFLGTVQGDLKAQ